MKGTEDVIREEDHEEISSSNDESVGND